MEAFRSNSPEVRGFEAQPFEIINIPEPMWDFANGQGLQKKRSTFETLEQKIFYLQDILEYSKDHEDFCLPLELKDYLEVMTKVFNTYKDRLSGYLSAEMVEDLIRRKIPIKEINVGEDIDTRDEEISYRLIDNFRETGGNKVCISVSHGGTWFALKAAHKTKEDESIKIGMIVFDNHVDIYSTGSNIYPNKGNVFRLLGDDETIEKVVFIGGLDESTMISNENSKLIMMRKMAKYEQIGIDSLKQGEKTDRLKLADKLNEVIRSCKESGITNIIFSIDVDVLRAERMGYTGFEYNPIDILENADSINENHNCLCKKPSELNVLDLDKLSSTIGRTNWLGSLDYYNPVGLALGDIGMSLDIIVQNCKKYGLNLGIKLVGGGTYFGDVVEMSGLDYKGRTTRSSVALLERIQRVIQN